jgi:hypothetical protein
MKVSVFCALAALSLTLAGCSTPQQSRLSETASTPLSDLNLVRQSIPPVLLEARKHPYAEPAEVGCVGLGAEILALEAVLEPDLDVHEGESEKSRSERLEASADDLAMQALRGAVEGVVPFRGWVRKLSGAERLSREVALAVAAGQARRSFLKGWQRAQRCS